MQSFRLPRVRFRGFSLSNPFSFLFFRGKFSFSHLRKSWNWITFLRLTALVFLFGTIATVVIFFIALAWVAKDLPDPNAIVRRSGFSTKIVDRNGTLLYDLYDESRRTPVKIEQVPDYLKQATVAIEDKDFYKHTGIDPLTPFRMVWTLVTRGKLIGGSTLTQQLVKTAVLTNEYSLTRKFKQMLLSIQIERKFTKDQILQMYLNEVPYGSNSMGVGAAAEVYFNKRVEDLTLLESAILAGLPQRPSAYSPYGGKVDEEGTPLWQMRTRGVLRRMKEDGYISEELESQALAELPNVQFNKTGVAIRAPHFVFYVKDQLEQMYEPEIVERGGFTVTTSLDLPFQDIAQQTVAEEIAKVEKYNITNGSVVVMEPSSGEILAMVGSKDYFAKDYDGQFNVAVNGLRQPGSSIKPVTYLLALRKGMTPATMIADTPTKFPGARVSEPYEPRNYDGQFHGPVSLRSALGSSLNIPAVKLLGMVGVENMLKQAYDMGFVTLEPTSENKTRFGLSVTLGGGEVHLLDSVTAYSSFANGGTRVEPVSILKITDRDGKTLYEHRKSQGKRVMTEEESYLINHILSDNSARLISFTANSQLNYGGKAVAVKTGTTNNRKDNWTIGWTRNAIVGVWVGNNDNTSMTNVASGITGASPIWKKLTDYLIKNGRPADDWPVPSTIQAVKVDAVSGYPAHDGFPERDEVVLPATLPSLPDLIHTKLKLCRGEGKLATEVDIQKGEYDEKEYTVMRELDPFMKDGINLWQQGIDEWIGSQPADQQEKYRPPTELCGSKDDVYVRLKYPEDHHDYPETSLVFEVEAASENAIDRVEIFVNGSLKETLKSKPYKTTIALSKGRYTAYAKAFLTDGKEGKSNETKFGTGNEHWEEPPPSPTPTPTPTPSPTPTQAPTPTPTPTPTSSP